MLQLKEKLEQKITLQNKKKEKLYKNRTRMTWYALLSLLVFDILMFFYTMFVSVNMIATPLFVAALAAEILLFLITLPHCRISNRSAVFLIYSVVFSIPTIINLIYLTNTFQIFETITIFVRLVMLFMLLVNIKVKYVNDILIFANLLAVLSFCTLLMTNESFTGGQNFSRRIKYANVSEKEELFVAGVDIGYSDRIIIPNNYAGKRVTQIGRRAFKNINSGSPVRSLHIPDNIEYIDDNAFTSCSKQLTITIDATNVDFNSALSKCRTIKEIRFNNGVVDGYDFSFLANASEFDIYLPKDNINKFVTDPYVQERLLPILDKNEIYVNFYSFGKLISIDVYNTASGPVNITAPALIEIDITNNRYFRGWYDNENLAGESVAFPTQIDKNSRFFAKHINAYYIDFVVADYPELNSRTYFNREMGVLPLPSHNLAGRNFYGWYGNDLYEGQAASTIDTATSSNMRFYAYTTLISYSISYYNTKGVANSNPTQYTVADNFILSSLSKDGYRFDGWYNNNHEKIIQISQMSGNLELFAEWSLVNFEINYVLGYTDSVFQTTQYYTVESVDLAAAPIRAHYDFVAWHLDALDGEVITDMTGISRNVSIYAEWMAKEYTITYYDGIVYQTEETYIVEDGILTLATLNKNGYRFLGWGFEENATSSFDTYDSSLGGDLVLLAQWELLDFNITYDFAGIKNNTNGTYSITTVGIPASGNINHYTFLGWFDKPMTDLSAAQITSLLGYYTDNLVLYGHYAPMEYRIEYDFSNSFSLNFDNTDVDELIDSYNITNVPTAINSVYDDSGDYIVVDWLDLNSGKKLSELTIDDYGDLLLTPESVTNRPYDINYFNVAYDNGLSTDIRVIPMSNNMIAKYTLQTTYTKNQGLDTYLTLPHPATANTIQMANDDFLGWFDAAGNPLDDYNSDPSDGWNVIITGYQNIDIHARWNAKNYSYASVGQIPLDHDFNMNQYLFNPSCFPTSFSLTSEFDFEKELEEMVIADGKTWEHSLTVVVSNGSISIEVKTTDGIFDLPYTGTYNISFNAKKNS